MFQQVSASTNPATVTATTTPTAAKDDDDASSNDTLTPKDVKNGKTSPKELSSKSQAVVQSVVRNDVKGTTEKIYSGKSSL